MEFITADERVCPKPTLWNDLFRNIKQEALDRGITQKISNPLILAAWHEATDAQKQQRLVEHVEFSESHGFLPVVDSFLRSIPDDDWHRRSKTSHQNVPELVRKEKLQRDSSIKITILSDGLENLRKFVSEHGHSRVPSKYIDDNGFKLGRWVVRCRNDYDNSKLAPNLVQQLESINGWMWNIDGGSVPSEGFEGLKRFVAEYGHAKVPLNYQNSDGFKLGRWVNNCQNKFRNSKLNPDQVRKLESLIGWEWGSE